MLSNRTELLYIFAFSVHMLFCYFIANSEQIPMLVNVTEWGTKIYGTIGFHWSLKVSYVLSSGILSSFICNVIRRALEGAIIGWPRFAEHDRRTLIRAWVRAFLYVFFVFFALGATGENKSRFLEELPYSRALDSFEILYISIVTFIFGAIANILDDAISATIVCLKGDRSWAR